MAIDSVVIRLTPYDLIEYGGYAGVSRYPLNYDVEPTAIYPGFDAFTSIQFSPYGGEFGELAGYFSGMETEAAGLTGPVREFPFVTLGEDGATLEPIDQSVTEIYFGFYAMYSGGTVEIGAYIDGVYTALGSADLGIPYDGSSGWDYIGIKVIPLVWGETPGFWTQFKQATEIA